METNEKKEFINDNIIYKKTLSISGIIYLASNPQLSSSASFLRLNVLSSLN